MKKTFIRMIYGVPLVRLVKKNKDWWVETRESETSDVWTIVGGPFSSEEMAYDQACEICEF